MLIVAGENIPYVREVFSQLGEVRIVRKNEMSAGAVRDAELLLVRSVVKVDEGLLAGSRVRFVATATIGTDHVDASYLRSRGIGFASAPGSNARSVAEYVAAALLVLESRGVVTLRGSTLGVVGVGEVGSRVAKVAEALGMKTLLNDPPRARREGREGFVSLDDLAASSDVVTLHVPLERGGQDPTYHLLGAEFLAKLACGAPRHTRDAGLSMSKAGAVVLNTSRGAVADTAALVSAQRAGKLGALVLDVWEGEPDVPRELFRVTDIGTPHVAGHSFDGKVAGTRMIYEAACRFLRREPAWPEDLPPREELKVRLEGPAVLDAVRASYEIEADHEGLCEIVRTGSSEERAAAFGEFRNTYRRRREFRNWEVELANAARPAEPTLRALGFRIAGS